jgi:hypothetical protein
VRLDPKSPDQAAWAGTTKSENYSVVGENKSGLAICGVVGFPRRALIPILKTSSHWLYLA